jgi:thiamine pyrophosphokinase
MTAHHEVAPAPRRGGLDPRLDRHIARCDNAVPPYGRIALRIGEAPVGWVSREVARALRDIPDITADVDGIRLAHGARDGLATIVAALAARGICRVRGEAFDVRAAPDGPVLGQVDRGALPVLGIAAAGVHVNGLVRRADGPHLWVALRSREKLLDPGKLDHIVAGGISAGMNAAETLIKEAAEEAGIAADLARRAVPVATISYAMDRGEGLRRDVLHCFDLDLPADFVPRAVDGEVERFELWPIARVLDRVRATDDFKFNVNLVLIDLFQRFGLA